MNNLFPTSEGRFIYPTMQGKFPKFCFSPTWFLVVNKTLTFDQTPEGSVGEAAFMTGLERNSDIVFTAGYALLLNVRCSRVLGLLLY